MVKRLIAKVKKALGLKREKKETRVVSQKKTNNRNPQKNKKPRSKPKYKSDSNRIEEWTPGSTTNKATAPKERNNSRPKPRPKPKPKSSPKPSPKQKPWDPASFAVPEVEGKARFHDFDIPNEIMHAIADQKFEYCTPIQEQSLPHVLKGRDLTGKAQTGTGKTAAFLIAALSHMARNPRKGNIAKGVPRMLIIAPTRELVIQICRDAEDLDKYCEIKSMAVFGGIDYEKQKRRLHNEVIDLVAATPGRLLDFQRKRDINLREVEVLVIDEADRMLDMGFIPDVRQIVRATPPKEKRQTMFFSATINDTVKQLASQWTKNPLAIDIEPEQVAVDTVDQRVMMLRAIDKPRILYNILKTEKPVRTLIFCNRRDTTQKVADNLYRHDINCGLLSGQVNQNLRMKTLDAFRAGTIPVVVATDVAGRGIHVDGIDLVINYDIPYEPEEYVHRIGRTGRAGASGRAYTFACELEAFTLPEIEEYLGKSLKYDHPDDSLLKPMPRPVKDAPVRATAEHRPQRSGGNRGSSRSSRPQRSGRSRPR